jgi:hypothetical protein
MILGLPSSLAPLQAFALVTSPRLGLRQTTFKTEKTKTKINLMDEGIM